MDVLYHISSMSVLYIHKIVKEEKCQYTRKLDTKKKDAYPPPHITY